MPIDFTDNETADQTDQGPRWPLSDLWEQTITKPSGIWMMKQPTGETEISWKLPEQITRGDDANNEINKPGVLRVNRCPVSQRQPASRDLISWIRST